MAKNTFDPFKPASQQVGIETLPQKDRATKSGKAEKQVLVPRRVTNKDRTR